MDLTAVIEAARARRNLPAPEICRALRERLGVSQADVAAVVGVDRASVSRWEHGRRRPRGTTLQRYLELLQGFASEA